VLVILCYAVARLGGTLVLRPQLVSPFWLGNVFLVSVLLLVPGRIWPVLLVAGLFGFLLYDLRTGVPIRSTVWLIFSNAIEVLTAVLCLRYAFDGVPQLTSVKALAKYCFYAVFLAPFVGAFFGALSTRSIYWASWKVAFFSEALGFLALMPAILGWARIIPEWTRTGRGEYLEVALLLAALLVAGHLVFDSPGKSSPALLYSLVPLLLWSTLRFRATGISTSILLIAFLAIWGAVHSRGPFAEPGTAVDVFSLQLFLFFTAAPFMVLAVLVEERKETEQILRQRDAELTEAQRLAQIGSWRWDSNTDRVTWSAELCRLVGHKLSQLSFSPEDHEQFFSRDSWNRLKQAAKRALETRSAYELDLEGIRVDGARIWLTVRGEPVIDRHGQPVYFRGTAQEITDKKRSEEALLALSGRLITAQEEERSRIARELHDDLSQRMAIVQMGLVGLKRAETDLSSEAEGQLNDLLRLLSELSSDLHDLSHQLHPAALANFGLVHCLKSFSMEFSTQHKVTVRFYHEVTTQIPYAIALCLFRIVQEALRNVVKHSGAAEANIELSGHIRGIDLRISDSGCGFDIDSGKQTSGLGLASMRERVRLCRGHLSVESQPAHGTSIHVHIPRGVTTDELGEGIH
jgi:PAS domain S-box-containing protein